MEVEQFEVLESSSDGFEVELLILKNKIFSLMPR
jgi:hypothetical protein